MINITTNINNTNNHLSSQLIEHIKVHKIMALEIHVRVWNGHQNIAGLNWDPNLHPLDNWSNDNTDIKQMKKMLHRFSSTQKDHILFKKINANINMDSLIVRFTHGSLYRLLNQIIIAYSWISVSLTSSRLDIRNEHQVNEFVYCFFFR